MSALTVSAVCRLHPGLAEAEIVAWIERDLVRAERAGDDWVLREIDIARVRLIAELRLLAVEDETLPLVLSLLDRLYAERRRLRRLRDALEAAPAPVREALLQALGAD